MEELRAISAYGELSPMELEDVATGVRWVFETFTDCLVHARGLTRDEVDRLKRIGVTRAHQGFLLAEVERGFHAVVDRIRIGHLGGLAAQRSEPEVDVVLEQLDTALTALGETAQAAIADGHAAGQSELLPDGTTSASGSVAGVLAGNADEETLARHARRLGIPIEDSCSLLVAIGHANSDPSNLYAVLDRLVDVVAGAVAGPVLMRPLHHAVALAPRRQDGRVLVDGIRVLAEQHGVVVLLDSTTGLAPAGDTYRRRLPLLDRIRASARGPGLVSPPELTEYELAATSTLSLAYEHIHRVLGPLLAQPRPVASSPPTLRFVGAVPGKAQEAIDGSGLKPTIETNAKFTLAQLRESTIQAIDTLAARGFEEAIAGVDERAGRVYLTVRDRHGRETAQSVRKALPDAVRPVVSTVEVRRGPIIQPTHTRGGNWMADDGANECTSGWSVRRLSDGVEGVALAAHCEGINQFRDATGLYSAPWKDENIGKWGELEWHTTSHIELAEFWADSSHLRDTQQIESANNISVGESVCIYGRASNNRNCNADVEDAWISITFEWDGCGGCQVTANRMVRMDRRAGVQKGDSGGGWSFNNRAYGIHFGRIDSDGDAAWSRADYLDEALGVQVMTK